MTNDTIDNQTTYEHTLITKPIAEQMLASIRPGRVNVHPLHQQLVERLATAMSTGRWIETGESIKFDQDGYLLDGKHRLAAVLASGTEQMMLVARRVVASAAVLVNLGPVKDPKAVL
jgi:hypothetical protein